MIIEEELPQVKEKLEDVAKKIYIGLLKEGSHIYLTTPSWSSSMYPFIKGTDVIKVAPIKEKDIKIGDVVAIDINKDKGRPWFYAHRVVKIFSSNNGKLYVTKGDANPKDRSEAVRFDRITGKVVEIERRGLRINFEHPLWDAYLNRLIARVSARHGRILRAFAPYISLLLEWRWFYSKLKRRLKRADEPRYNAQELLLVCARMDLDEDLIDKAKDLLRKSINWEFFLETAIQSGMPFVFRNSLNKINNPSIIPREFIARLRGGYFYALSKASFQYKEAKGLLELFFQKGIRTVPLKGPFLSKRLYGDIAARGASADIDLLIEEKNLDLAKGVLEKAGYLYNEDSKEMEWTQQSVFQKPAGIMIDLHWGIRPDATNRERMSGFWEGARLEEDDGVSYYEFKEEELLLYLSAHFIGSGHSAGLRYICDLDRLLTKYREPLDWMDIIEKAKRWKLSNSLYAALILSKRLFQSYIPDKVLVKLRPGLPKRFIINIVASKVLILRGDSKARQFMDRFLKYIIFQALAVSSFKDFFTLFFPSREVLGSRTYLQRVFSGMEKFSKGLGRKKPTPFIA